MDAGGVFRSLDGYSSSIHLDLQEKTPWREAGQPTKFFSMLSPPSSVGFGGYCRDANHAGENLFSMGPENQIKPPTLLIRH